jgi:nicotinamidase-related amidase
MSKPSTALVVMDFQVALVGMCPGAPAAVERVSEAIKKARFGGLPIIYGAVRLRPGHADVSDRNDMFTGVAASGAFDSGAPTADFHPSIAPDAEDIVFVKRRVSAFSGSDLDIILRSLNVETVALAGLFTGGVVLSTLREAADRDFRAVVLSDACADPDLELHEVLLSRVFPSQASVKTVDSWEILARESGG